MYVPNIEQLMILIISVDENACIKYSTATGMFYLSSNILVFQGNGRRYSNSPIHRSTIKEAVVDFYKEIQGKLIKLSDDTRACKLPKLIV